MPKVGTLDSGPEMSDQHIVAVNVHTRGEYTRMADGQSSVEVMSPWGTDRSRLISRLA